MLNSLVCGSFCCSYWHAFPVWSIVSTKFIIPARYILDLKIFSLDVPLFHFICSFVLLEIAHVWAILLQTSDDLLQNCPIHIKKKQQTRIKPSWMTTRRAMTYKYPQIFQQFMLCCMQLKRNFMFLCGFFVLVQWKRQFDGNLIPISKRAPFRLFLDASVGLL